MRTPTLSQELASGKRRFLRAPLRVKIEVQTDSNLLLPALLMDLLSGGCQIASRASIEKSSRLSYRFARGAGTPDLQLHGVVRSKRYADSERMYFYGIIFETLDEAAHAILLSEIAAFERLIVRRKRVADARRAPLEGRSKKTGESGRCTYRVSWPFDVTYKIPGIPGTHRAHALDISAGGMRIATDMILRLEWKLALTFTFPAQVLDVLERSEAIPSPARSGNLLLYQKKCVRARPFAPITVGASVVPGVLESRGRYVQGIRFENADPLILDEIARFVHAVQLSKRRLAV